MTDDLNRLIASLLNPTPPKQNDLSGLARFLSEDSSPLGSRAGGVGPLVGSPVNHLARGLVGVPTKPTSAIIGNHFLNALAPTIPEPPPRPAPRRHVFFSFHFQADIGRVNIVRNSWRIRPEDKVPGFFDRSLWEQKKRTDKGALKRMIKDGLKGTSVTCVLAGEFTWERPWVRYELAESVFQGNGLLTVDIDELRCLRTKMPCSMGRNPLDYMGVYRADDGRAYVCELTEGGWVQYGLLTDPVAWPAYLHDSGKLNVAQPLSVGTRRYAYRSDGGYKNLMRWVWEAARAARRK
jgi:hypothetical protein